MALRHFLTSEGFIFFGVQITLKNPISLNRHVFFLCGGNDGVARRGFSSPNQL